MRLTLNMKQGTSFNISVAVIGQDISNYDSTNNLNHYNHDSFLETLKLEMYRIFPMYGIPNPNLLDIAMFPQYGQSVPFQKVHYWEDVPFQHGDDDKDDDGEKSTLNNITRTLIIVILWVAIVLLGLILCYNFPKIVKEIQKIYNLDKRQQT